MTVVGPPEARPVDGLAIDFVVESDRAQLGEIVQRVRDGLEVPTVTSYPQAQARDLYPQRPREQS